MPYCLLTCKPLVMLFDIIGNHAEGSYDDKAGKSEPRATQTMGVDPQYLFQTGDYCGSGSLAVAQIKDLEDMAQRRSRFKIPLVLEDSGQYEQRLGPDGKTRGAQGRPRGLGVGRPNCNGPPPGHRRGASGPPRGRGGGIT